jgi:hypothetical protein
LTAHQSKYLTQRVERNVTATPASLTSTKSGASPTGEAAGDYRVMFKEPNPKLYGIRDGERMQAVEAQFLVHFTVFVGFAPFSFRTYMDMGRLKQLKQVATCTVQVGDVEADLVLSPNKEGLITVALVQSPPALPGPSEK